MAFDKLSFIFKDKNVPIYLKRKTHDSCILPVATYGLETMTMTKNYSKYGSYVLPDDRSYLLTIGFTSNASAKKKTGTWFSNLIYYFFRFLTLSITGTKKTKLAITFFVSYCE